MNKGCEIIKISRYKYSVFNCCNDITNRKLDEQSWTTQCIPDYSQGRFVIASMFWTSKKCLRQEKIKLIPKLCWSWKVIPFRHYIASRRCSVAHQQSLKPLQRNIAHSKRREQDNFNIIKTKFSRYFWHAKPPRWEKALAVAPNICRRCLRINLWFPMQKNISRSWGIFDSDSKLNHQRSHAG